MTCDFLVLYSDRTEIGEKNHYIVLACANFPDFLRKTP